MELTSIYPSSFSFLSAITRTRHDVFLSFRGEDTRYNITRQLHRALEEAGIPTFKDDVYLEKGGDIATELLKAIQMSRTAVIVFSRNYADSRWCLDELAKIIECKNEAGQAVVPVFYDVDPGDVTQQKNSYGRALDAHEEKFRIENSGEGKVDKWKSALTEAASSPSSVDMTENDESWNQFIKEIVKHIVSRHQDAHMSASIFPQRKDAAEDYLNLLLSTVSDDILIIGVWGVDKTNTAKAVYNKNLERFRHSSFVSGVSVVAEQPDGLISLQKQFLSDILLEKNINISDVTAGTDMIKNVLRDKRVLAVLDDVNKLDHLNALARNRDWFGAGSRVIITTKDPQLLNVLEVDDVYGTESIQVGEVFAFLQPPKRENQAANSWLKAAVGCVLEFGEVIEDQFKQNIEVIKGLMDYIHKFQAKACESEMSIIAKIEKEKQKNALQEEAIAELQGRINS